MSTTTSLPDMALVPFDSPDFREWRRFRAWALFQQGWLMIHIAVALGVTCGAVSQWLKRVRHSGLEALRRRKSPGAPTRLTAEQMAQIPSLLLRGPQAWGFVGQLWTRERIAQVIEREFGVRYHVSHIGRLMKEAGWTVQKPERRSTRRDEEAIQEWREQRWPELKKKAKTKASPPCS